MRIQNVLILFAITWAFTQPLNAQDRNTPKSTEFFGEGLESLQKSYTKKKENGDVVRAAKSFAHAAKLFDDEGNNELADNAYACAFWCKHMMTEADVEVYNDIRDETLADAFVRLDEKKAPPEQSAAMLSLAEAFAKQNPQAPWVVAARYYEISKRYEGTESGEKAASLFDVALETAQISSAGPEEAEELLRKHSEVYAKETDKFKAEVADDASTYREKLADALTYESKRGNLDLANAIKEELEAVANSKGTSKADLKDSSKAARAQKNYNRAYARAEKSYMYKLKSVSRSFLREDKLALATIVQERLNDYDDRMKELEFAEDRIDLAKNLEGRWQIGKQGYSSSYYFEWDFKKDGTFKEMRRYTWGGGTPSYYDGTWTYDGKNVKVKLGKSSRAYGEFEAPMRGNEFKGTWIDYDRSFPLSGRKVK